MAGGDIALRGNGGTAGDIALSDAGSSASFAGTSSFGATGTALFNAAGSFTGTSSFGAVGTALFNASGSFAGTSVFGATSSLVEADGSFTGTSSFGATAVAIISAAGSFTGTSSFGATNSGPAEVSSVRPEVLVHIGDVIEVASMRPEVLLHVEDVAEVASVRPEVLVHVEDAVKVSSVRPEVLVNLLRFYDPYTPYTPGGSGGNQPTCVFERPVCGFARPMCDGFSQPYSGWTIPSGGGGGGTPGPPEQLAFEKATADAVVLCTRRRSGFYPTGALSAAAWVRVTSFDGPGEIPVLDAFYASTLGWRLALRGTPNPTQVAFEYIDTVGVVRRDAHASTSGSYLTSGWTTAGGFRSVDVPWTLTAFANVDPTVSTDGTVAPQSGTGDVVTLFGDSTGTGLLVGQIIAPVLVGQNLDSESFQVDYYNDLATRQDAAIFASPNLILAPRARSSVVPDDAVELWAIDEDSVRIAGPRVTGTPGLWRGPNFGLLFSDLHYLTVPWVSSNLSAGRTLITMVQGSGIPAGAVSALVGRTSGVVGGLQVDISNVDGIGAVFTAYNSAGGLVLTLTVNVATGPNLGSPYWYAFSVGVDGTASCTAAIYNSAGRLGTASGVPSGPIALERQYWGRNETDGNAYSDGFAFRWIEVPAFLADAEVREVVAGTYAGTISRNINGVDSNIVDDGDQNVLWGYYDPTGTYGSTIKFVSVGTQITPGS